MKHCHGFLRLGAGALALACLSAGFFSCASPVNRSPSHGNFSLELRGIPIDYTKYQVEVGFFDAKGGALSATTVGKVTATGQVFSSLELPSGAATATVYLYATSLLDEVSWPQFAAGVTIHDGDQVEIDYWLDYELYFNLSPSAYRWGLSKDWVIPASTSGSADLDFSLAPYYLIGTDAPDTTASVASYTASGALVYATEGVDTDVGWSYLLGNQKTAGRDPAWGTSSGTLLARERPLLLFMPTDYNALPSVTVDLGLYPKLPSPQPLGTLVPTDDPDSFLAASYTGGLLYEVKVSSKTTTLLKDLGHRSSVLAKVPGEGTVISASNDGYVTSYDSSSGTATSVQYFNKGTYPYRYPKQVGLDGVHRRIYLLDRENSDYFVTILNLDTLATIDASKTGNSPDMDSLAIDATHQLLYLSSSTGVRKYDVSADQIDTASLTSSSLSYPVIASSLSADGNRLALLVQGGQAARVLETSDFSNVGTTTLANAKSLVLNTDGTEVISDSSSTTVVRFPSDGSSSGTEFPTFGLGLWAANGDFSTVVVEETSNNSEHSELDFLYAISVDPAPAPALAVTESKRFSKRAIATGERRLLPLRHP